jgi:hypothetical protein
VDDEYVVRFLGNIACFACHTQAKATKSNRIPGITSLPELSKQAGKFKFYSSSPRNQSGGVFKIGLLTTSGTFQLLRTEKDHLPPSRISTKP